MNERIRLLLSQAGIHYEVLPKDTVYEKFAELIVRECAEVGNSSDPLQDGGIGRMIKRHFGIEQ